MLDGIETMCLIDVPFCNIVSGADRLTDNEAAQIFSDQSVSYG